MRLKPFGSVYICTPVGADFADKCFHLIEFFKDDVSFKIRRGEKIAIVGESGCGKTTILNLISHMYYKTGGNIYFDGVPIENLSREFVKKKSKSLRRIYRQS